MKTRVFGILLALVLLVTGTAMATEGEAQKIPSITWGDTTNVGGATKADGTALPDDFKMTTESNDTAKATYDLISKHIKEDKQPASTILSQSCQEQIQKQLDEKAQGTKHQDLVVYDSFPLSALNYDKSMGDVNAKISFATPYQENKLVFAAVTIPSYDENGNLVLECVMVPVQVVAEGELQFVFDEEIMSKLQPGCTVMLLSERLAK